MSFFGDRLRECRENKGIGRQELAHRLGVSRNTVGLWERGERLPRSWELVCELADILQVSVAYFSDENGDRDNNSTIADVGKNPVIRDLEKRVSRLESSLQNNLHAIDGGTI